VFRSAHRVVILATALCTLLSSAQSSPSPLVSYFTGKEVVLKIDMPGSQKGVDLRYNKEVLMDWKEYSGRIKQYGAAIRKGDTARVTGIVVKDDRIEFQLDGGGFGTFGDDSDATVRARPVEKSDYEKNLERQIANTDDPDLKRKLQRDLDRERSRRERQEADNRNAAQIASQIKAQKVADDRTRGGSRFNLRWPGSIPAGQKNPDAVMKLLADYVSFPGPQDAGAAAPAPQNAAGDAAIPATAQLKRGMHIDDVTKLFGPGQKLSESVSPEGLKTQTFQYATGDRQVDVIYVEGLVVRYSISSK
jgi:hypothetical protein